MARARNIKPALFTNELLAELPAFDRLLFIGIWCLADREGRLEDRPKRIKMELFPCDEYSVSDGLARLAESGFLDRYQIEGKSVIEVVNFQKHQSPHGTEKDSVLPDKNGYLTVYERKNKNAIPGTQRLVHVKEQLNNVISPLHNALIPDSLIPDSLIQDKDQKLSSSGKPEDAPGWWETPDELGDDPKQDEMPPPSKPVKAVSVPYQKILEAYQRILPELPQPVILSESRKAAIASRWKQDERFRDVEFWERYFEQVKKSSFLMGMRGTSIDWLTKPTNFLKVIEGNYDDA